MRREAGKKVQRLDANENGNEKMSGNEKKYNKAWVGWEMEMKQAEKNLEIET